MNEIFIIIGVAIALVVSHLIAYYHGKLVALLEVQQAIETRRDEVAE